MWEQEILTQMFSVLFSDSRLRNDGKQNKVGGERWRGDGTSRKQAMFFHRNSSLNFDVDWTRLLLQGYYFPEVDNHSRSRSGCCFHSSQECPVFLSAIARHWDHSLSRSRRTSKHERHGSSGLSSHRPSRHRRDWPCLWSKLAGKIYQHLSTFNFFFEMWRISVAPSATASGSVAGSSASTKAGGTPPWPRHTPTSTTWSRNWDWRWLLQETGYLLHISNYRSMNLQCVYSVTLLSLTGALFCGGRLNPVKWRLLTRLSATFGKKVIIFTVSKHKSKIQPSYSGLYRGSNLLTSSPVQPAGHSRNEGADTRSVSSFAFVLHSRQSVTSIPTTADITQTDTGLSNDCTSTIGSFWYPSNLDPYMLIWIMDIPVLRHQALRRIFYLPQRKY